MKSVQIMVPKDKTKLVLSVLSNLNLPYTKMEAEKVDIIISILKDEAVEILMEAVKKIGVGTVFGSIQILPLEYAALPTEIKETKKIPRASKEEILQDIEGKARFDFSYIMYTIISAVIATLGLLTDNIVMIIASMIIAPLIGPIMGFSLGTTLSIRELQRESLKAEVLGILISIMVGVVVTAFTPFLTPTEQIMIRANPTYMDIIFALAAGLAAAISIASVETMSLIGVAIAASILPPATNVGVGLTFMVKGVPEAETIVIGSLALLIINILAINFMSLTYFWFSGIKTTISARKKTVTKKVMVKRFFAMIVLMVIVSYPIVTWTNQHFTEVNTENRLEQSIRTYIENKYSAELEVLEISVKYDSTQNKATIMITVALKESSFNVTKLAYDVASFVKNNYSFDSKVFVSVLYSNISSKYSLTAFHTLFRTGFRNSD